MAAPCQRSLFTKWSQTELSKWLKEKGVIDSVANIFEVERITGENIAKNVWNHDNLKRMGIKTEGDRLKCLSLIGELRQRLVVQKSKIFQDSIHGAIQLHPLLVKIIDTQQFQRLRNIKQLGGVYYVFPGASHNRFEHSIGVCYLAGEFVENLRKHQPELGITDCDVLCVKIAGLCHDMGHGPYSHLYQDLFIPKFHTTRDWKHEETSIKLMEYMIETNKELSDKFKQYDIVWEIEKTFIKELIYGKPSDGTHGVSRIQLGEFKGRDESKHFLYEIVANQVNGVDVDKMDYLLRDSHGLGIRVHFDWKRYIEFARVIANEEGKLSICPRDKEVRNIYELFNIRDRLFRSAYQHKTKRAVEFMLLDAMSKANDHIKIPGKNGNRTSVRMSDAIDDMEAFTNLTDNTIYAILFYPVPKFNDKLKKARIILKKLQTRKLYLFADKTLIIEGKDKPHINQSDFANQIVKNCEDMKLACIPKKDKIIVDRVKFNYGQEGKNPIESISFYDKSSPNKALLIKRENVSRFLPETFEEWEIRVYYKEFDKEARQSVKIGFQKKCEDEKSEMPGRSQSQSHDGEHATVTPSPTASIDSDNDSTEEPVGEKSEFVVPPMPEN